MNSPTRGSSTSTSQIQVDWTALTSPSDGYSTITSYHLQWDSGTSGATFSDLLGSTIDSTALTFTVSSSVIGGSNYQFRVRAKNYWGWGDYSSAVTIKASAAPDQMAAVTTSIDSTTGGVKIEWIAPNSNSDSISAYLIEILDTTDATWTADTTNCDGSNSVIASNLYCVIPMSTLIIAPYSYTYG